MGCIHGTCMYQFCRLCNSIGHFGFVVFQVPFPKLLVLIGQVFFVNNYSSLNPSHYFRWSLREIDSKLIHHYQRDHFLSKQLWIKVCFLDLSI